MIFKKYSFIFCLFYLGSAYSQVFNNHLDTAKYYFKINNYLKSFQEYKIFDTLNPNFQFEINDLYRYSFVAEKCGKTNIANIYLEKVLNNGFIDSKNKIDYLKNNHPIFENKHQSKDVDSMLNLINFKIDEKKSKLDYYLNILSDTNLKIKNNLIGLSIIDEIPKKNVEFLLNTLAKFNRFPIPPKTNYFALYYLVENNVQIPYIVYIPDNYNNLNKNDLYVYLHGGTANIEEFTFTEEYTINEPIFKWAKENNKLVLYPLGKKTLGWHSGFKAISNVYEMINQVKVLYNINDLEIFFIGMSNGANGVIQTALNFPKYFNKFIGISSPPILCDTSLIHNINNNDYQLILLHSKDDEVYSFNEINNCVQKNNSQNISLKTFNNNGHGFIFTDSGFRFLSKILIQNSKYKRKVINNKINWTFNPQKKSEFKWLKIEPLPNSSLNDCNIEICKKGNDFFITHKSVEHMNVILKIQLFYKDIDYLKPVRVFNQKNEIIYNEKIELVPEIIIMEFKKVFDRNNILLNMISLHI